MIWSEDAINNINSGYGVSGACVAKTLGPGGTYNSISYDKEVLGGTYHHLAIVSNPMYSDIEIIQTSNTDAVKENAATVEAEAEAKKNVTLELTDTVDVDGEYIDVKTLLDAYIAATTPTTKNEESEVKENAVPKAETKNANFNA